MHSQTLIQHLIRVASGPRAQAPFIIQSDQSCSYAAFAELVRAFSAQHRDQHPPGSRIAIYCGKRLEHAVAFLGSINLGLIPVQIYPTRSPQFVNQAILETGAVRLFNDPHTSGKASPQQCPLNTVHIAQLRNSPKAPLTPGQHEQGTILYTSGTTSSPKGVLFSSANLLALATRSIQIGQIRPGAAEGACQLIGATYHTGTLLGHMLSGTCLVDIPWDINQPQYHRQTLQYLIKHQITHISIRPATLLDMLQEHPQTMAAVGKHMQTIITGWTPIDPQIPRLMLAHMPQTRLVIMYGLTEASRSTHFCLTQEMHKLGTVGHAPRDGQIAIHEPDPNGIGHVKVKGSTLMQCYWNQPDATRAIQLEDNWLRTNDIGQIDKDGYLTILGRSDELINANGLKTLPGPIEKLLNNHPAVAQCAVVAIPDPKNYQVPGAMIIPKASNPPHDLAEQIRTWAQIHAQEAHHVPQYIQIVDKIPVNQMGKILRSEIAADIQRAIGRSS